MLANVSTDLLFFWRNFIIAYTKIAVIPLESAFMQIEDELNGRGMNLKATGR